MINNSLCHTICYFNIISIAVVNSEDTVLQIIGTIYEINNDYIIEASFCNYTITM